ncbi:hypothetical protein RhiirB3_529329 [Rhizophagus irregularis]|nr:hypothetical protein RhiirB3_529329 [Rhizophagus irregularis]
MNGVINNETEKFYAFSSITNAPLPRVDYTATLLFNGVIDFIGGREINNLVNVYINQANKYSSDEKIIIFDGNKDDIITPVLNPLAVLNTKVVPYEWSVPTPAPSYL